MRISVFGMGYVGCVSMGCLARMGHTVIGVDINQSKVDLVNRGLATIVEDGVDALISDGRRTGGLSATEDSRLAVADSELSLLCVPTPSGPDGHLDLSFVRKVASDIAVLLPELGRFHTVVLRSTVPPGTTAEVVSIMERESGLEHGTDFAVVHNPEFLREGSSVSDFFNPPLIVIGTLSDKGASMLGEMYRGIELELTRVPVKVAEMIKYVSNSYHALKVSFANEIGRICRAGEIDAAEVMRVFRMDHQLNISGTYLKPGFAYGGSCLPKDLGGICAMATSAQIDAPLLEAVQPSNRAQVMETAARVIKAGSRRVAVIGLSFKEGTDDLRNSPSVELVEYLHGKGYEISIYDDRVVYSSLTGRNREFIDSKLPHVGAMLRPTPHEALEDCGTVVVLQKGTVDSSLFEGMTVIDATPE